MIRFVDGIQVWPSCYYTYFDILIISLVSPLWLTSKQGPDWLDIAVSHTDNLSPINHLRPHKNANQLSLRFKSPIKINWWKHEKISKIISLQRSHPSLMQRSCDLSIILSSYQGLPVTHNEPITPRPRPRPQYKFMLDISVLLGWKI